MSHQKRFTLPSTLIAIFITMLMDTSFANTSSILFQNIQDVRSCLSKHDNFDTSKTSIKSCHESRGLKFSDEALDKLSPKINIFLAEKADVC